MRPATVEDSEPRQVCDGSNGRMRFQVFQGFRAGSPLFFFQILDTFYMWLKVLDMTYKFLIPTLALSTLLHLAHHTNAGGFGQSTESVTIELPEQDSPVSPPELEMVSKESLDESTSAWETTTPENYRGWWICASLRCRMFKEPDRSSEVFLEMTKGEMVFILNEERAADSEFSEHIRYAKAVRIFGTEESEEINEVKGYVIELDGTRLPPQKNRD